MSTNNIEYVCPIILLILIALLKVSVDGEYSLEKVKRIIVELPVDIMSLSTSLVISYIIAIVNNIPNFDINIMPGHIYKGFKCFAIYIVFIVLTVLISKYAIRKYSKKEQFRYILLGVILGYTIAIPCIHYAIGLLQSLGGV